MRWFVSYPILAAGLAFGFDTLFPGEPDQSPRTPEIATLTLPKAEQPGIAASELDATPSSRVSAFSPGSDRLSAPERPSTSVLGYLAQTFSVSDTPPPAPTVLQPVTVSAWTNTVTRDTRNTQTAQSPRQAYTSRAALARDIQRELKRVGCYHGEIDGVWGGGSKRAILVFMDRVNAALPTREPDVFLLSLLRGQTQAVCGETCPQGQSLAHNGRCVPSTLMAQSGKASSEPLESREATTVIAEDPRKPALSGRMSIGGPKPEDVASLTTGWSPATTTVPSTVERTAALEPTVDDMDVVPDPAQDSLTQTPPEADAAPPVRRFKSARSRSMRAPARSNSYRQVQHLFQHPLGRM